MAQHHLSCSCRAPSEPPPRPLRFIGIDPAATALIARTLVVVRALLSGLPSTMLKAPNDEGSSLKDIVAHLHDVEGVAFVERIGCILQEERPLIRSIDPPARLIVGGYAARELDDAGEIRVVDIAHQWAAHDMSHLRQVALMIQQYLTPKLGRTRSFYDV